jgi:hypothetical protein
MPASAQEPAPVVELTLHPRAVESPPLSYRLFPSEEELKAGNAAPILLRLPWEQTIWMTKVFPTLHEWEARPLTAPEWKDAGNVLPTTFFNEMRRAAYRRDAAWEYPIGEQVGYSILLPDVQGLRFFLKDGLSVRIRYHLIRGELDQAREGILVGLANGRHLAQTPFFVNQLVATVVQRAMLDRTSELIAQKDSPNLYWALSTLPDSLIELERAADFEGTLFADTFPVAKDLDAPRDAAQWRKMSQQLVELLEQLQEIPPAPKSDAAKSSGDLIQELLKRLGVTETRRLEFVKSAREELAGLAKIAPEKVTAMSDDEVGIRWYVQLRMSRDQRTSAVMRLQPGEAWPRLKELQVEIDALREKTGGKGLEFFNPTNIYVNAWLLRRQVATLRIIEAVRHYAATNDGELPKSLGDIDSLSVPRDPLTEAPFTWSRDGKNGILSAPRLSAEVPPISKNLEQILSTQYRLQLP